MKFAICAVLPKKQYVPERQVITLNETVIYYCVDFVCRVGLDSGYLAPQPIALLTAVLCFFSSKSLHLTVSLISRSVSYVMEGLEISPLMLLNQRHLFYQVWIQLHIYCLKTFPLSLVFRSRSPWNNQITIGLYANWPK